MADEESMKEEPQEFREQNRHFEERLLGTKDGLLRLWERNRHLHERLGQAERRLTLVTWLLIAVSIGSAGMFTFLVMRVLAPPPDHVTELQAWIAPLQERIATLDQAGQTRDTRIEQVETALAESAQKPAPDLTVPVLNNAIHVDSAGNVGVGTTTPEAKLHVVGDLLGAAKGSADEALRIAVGTLDPKTARWMQYTDGGIYVDIDTSSAGFSSTPFYFTSLGGHTNSWLAQGVTSIYRPTPQGFRIHISYPELTVAQAKQWGWYINWIAVGS